MTSENPAILRDFLLISGLLLDVATFLQVCLSRIMYACLVLARYQHPQFTTSVKKSAKELIRHFETAHIVCTFLLFYDMIIYIEDGRNSVMAEAKRKSKARIEQSVLLPPATEPNGLIDRDTWIEETSSGFISKSPSNRFIYRVILETLWPKDHGIPGPIVDREDIRKAVDIAKGKTYIDAFRRLRELQGEEGLLGIVKQGNQYQLIDLNVYPKKTPRTHLSDEKWSRILIHYGNKCAVCGAAPGEKRFSAGS